MALTPKDLCDRDPCAAAKALATRGRLLAQNDRQNIAMSKVLEIQFNPPLKESEDYFFSSFCFCPDKRKEKPLGILCLLSEISKTNALEKDLLLTLNKVLKREYYKFSYSDPADCFKSALALGNNFLEKQSEYDQTFAEKINLTAFSLRQGLAVNLAKIGKTATLLFTGKNVFDLNKSVGKESGFFRAFSDTIEGYLENKDKILITTEGLYKTFQEQDIFRDILLSQSKKQAKKVFQTKKEILRNTSGACLLLFARGHTLLRPLSF